MTKRLISWSAALFMLTVLTPSAARADFVRVTGGFTSFTGVVTGDVLPAMFVHCPAATCGIGPGATAGFQVCPDLGCDEFSGLATDIPIGGNPTFDTASHLFFDTGTAGNALLLDFGDQNDASPSNQFTLGTLTFTNGLWTGNAKFGFSIVATDTTTSDTRRFDGFIHLVLTDNIGTPQQNADYVYITDAADHPVADPLTFTVLPSLRAYELDDSPTGTNTVTATLHGRFGSLDLTAIDNVTGAGFLDPSLTPELSGTQVPEPGTMTLFGAGFLAFALRRTRR